MRDKQTTNNEQVKIELLSQWKLEAESRNKTITDGGSTAPQNFCYQS